MKAKNIYSLTSVFIITGTIAGLVFSVADVAAEHFFQYRMFRLIALCLQKNLNKWVSISFVSSLIILLFFFILLFFWRFISNFLEFRIKNKKILRWPEFFKFLKTGTVNKTSLTAIVMLLLLNMGILIDRRVCCPRGPNIILIVVDCLRPDHLGCYGYKRDTSPAIDELAKNGIIFTNAYSNAPWTKPSVASMFTSVYPNEHGAKTMNDILPDALLTIAEFLKNSGYYTCYFNGGNYCIGKHFNFDQGFDYYTLKPSKLNKSTGLTDSFMAHVDSISPKKFFAYIHYMDTHVPYNVNRFNNLFVRKIDTYFEPGVDYISNWHIRIMTSHDRMSEEERSYLISLYDGQIRFVDESIKKMVAFLKDRKILDDTLIILTADHGEEFWEHNNYEHGHTLYNELLHVPLIIYGNRLKPAKVTERVRLIDLFPSIMQMASIEDKNSFYRGSSFKESIDGKGGQSEQVLFSTATLYGDEKYCLIKGDKKIIINSFERKDKKKLFGYACRDNLEIYNLSKDPHEKHNMEDSDIKSISQLKKELRRFRDLTPLFRDAEAVISEDLKSKLKAIGYMTD